MPLLENNPPRDYWIIFSKHDIYIHDKHTKLYCFHTTMNLYTVNVKEH